VVVVIPDFAPVPFPFPAFVPAPPLGRRGTAVARHPRADRAPPSGGRFLGNGKKNVLSLVACSIEKAFNSNHLIVSS
jgi:hypothetical protein